MRLPQAGPETPIERARAIESGRFTAAIAIAVNICILITSAAFRNMFTGISTVV
jgi:hypothetical protein